jgi:uncharacterized protein (UPF0264 family)
MTRLLVSVRSAAEAEIALEGGAGLIDVKEPANGPLGMATRQTITEVVRAVAGRVPVSAALGELRDGLPHTLPDGVTYYKWGLAGLGSLDWRGAIDEACRHLSRLAPESALVIVGYADWQPAEAPQLSEVVRFAYQRAGGGLLIDTYCKARVPGMTVRRPCLLDYCSVTESTFLCATAQAAGLRIALAGSLGREQIEQLLPARPDWFAVRGAVCDTGERDGIVVAARVRELVRLVDGHVRRERHAD